MDGLIGREAAFASERHRSRLGTRSEFLCEIRKRVAVKIDVPKQLPTLPECPLISRRMKADGSDALPDLVVDLDLTDDLVALLGQRSP